MVISDPQQTEHLNLTEARWVQYICNHENNVPSWLSAQWSCGNSCSWAHDVRVDKKMHKLPQSLCIDNREGSLFINIYIIYIYYIYIIFVYIIYKKYKNISIYIHQEKEFI